VPASFPQLPGYRVVDLLGRGGFGVVYRAVQEAVDREVAVKIDSRTMLDERDRRRFLREAQAAGRLSGHPNVVDLYDAGILPDGRPYLVMELCTGGSLLDRLKKMGPLPPAQACELGAKIAGALAAAHQAGVLHRDIKPANILINRYGVYGLTDFGLAALFEPGHESSASLAALTPAYAAPEAFRQESPTELADIYSLGATVYALLSGRPPRFPPTGEPNLPEIIRLHDQPVPDIAGVPVAVSDVLRKALAFDPMQRYESAAEFQDALAALKLAPALPVVPGQESAVHQAAPDGPESPTEMAEASSGDEPTSLIGEDPVTAAVRFGPQRDDTTTIGQIAPAPPSPLPPPAGDVPEKSPAGDVPEKSQTGRRGGFAKRLLPRVRRGLVLAMSILILVVVGIAWIVVASLTNDMTTGGIIGAHGSPDSNDGATDILLVGSDSRTDANGDPLPDDILKLLRTEYSGGVNTDTIVLVRIPNNGGRAVAMSIPRDAYVSIPNAEGGAINGAFGAGKRAKEEKLRTDGVTDERRLARESDEAGRKMLVEVVQNLTGVRVDHYAEINMYGFYLLTQAIGSVEVCLKQAVVDPDSGSNFKAGRQLVSGGDALSFVRQRHGLPNGDLDRIVRQQVFMAALVNKVLSSKVLTDQNAISGLRDTVARTVVIDDAGWDVLDFVVRLREVAVGNVDFVTVPVVDPNRFVNGKSIVAVDEAQVRAFAAGLLGGSAQSSQPSPSPAAPQSATPPSSTPTSQPSESAVTIATDGVTCVN